MNEMNSTDYNSYKCWGMEGFSQLGQYKKDKYKSDFKLKINVWPSFDKEMGVRWERIVSFSCNG